MQKNRYIWFLLSEFGTSVRTGRLAEWLMQRTANPFISVQFRYRPPKSFRLSSAVEQSAVNRSVICSNQIVGATKKGCRKTVFFAFKTLSKTHCYPTKTVYGIDWFCNTSKPPKFVSKKQNPL